MQAQSIPLSCQLVHLLCLLHHGFLSSFQSSLQANMSLRTCIYDCQQVLCQPTTRTPARHPSAKPANMVCETSSSTPVYVLPIAAAGQGTRQETAATRLSKADRHGMCQKSWLPGTVQQCYLYFINLRVAQFPDGLSLQILQQILPLPTSRILPVKPLALMRHKVAGPVATPVKKFHTCRASFSEMVWRALAATLLVSCLKLCSS